METQANSQPSNNLSVIIPVLIILFVGFISGLIYLKNNQPTEPSSLPIQNSGEISNAHFYQGRLFYAKLSPDFLTAELRRYNMSFPEDEFVFRSSSEGKKIVNLDYVVSSNNKIAVVVNYENPQADGADDIYGKTHTQKVFIIDLVSHESKEVIQKTKNSFETFTPIGLTDYYLYLSEANFEGYSNLVRLNLESTTIENLSEKLKLPLADYSLSPDAQTLALTTFTDFNKITFLDLKTGEITNSKLISGCSGEFPGGMDCFSGLTWLPNSKQIYATDRQKNGSSYIIETDGSFHDLSSE